MRKLIKKILTLESLWQSDDKDRAIEAISLDKKLEELVNESKGIY